MDVQRQQVGGDAAGTKAIVGAAGEPVCGGNGELAAGVLDGHGIDSACEERFQRVAADGERGFVAAQREGQRVAREGRREGSFL